MSLEEVAKLAKVSTSTVSRVLNNVGPVKKTTRARVIKAVAELKYHPNLHARTLAGGRSRTLGVIVSNLANPFFFDVFESLEAAALADGYDVMLANTGYDPERLVMSIRLMIGRRVAGLAAIVSEMDSRLIQLLNDASVPTVFYDVGPAVDRQWERSPTSLWTTAKGWRRYSITFTPCVIIAWPLSATTPRLDPRANGRRLSRKSLAVTRRRSSSEQQLGRTAWREGRMPRANYSNRASARRLSCV
jgi:hypothetical protein